MTFNEIELCLGISKLIYDKKIDHVCITAKDISGKQVVLKTIEIPKEIYEINSI